MALAGALGPGPAADSEPLEWHFSQVFGERSPGEEVQDGERRALGRGGRCLPVALPAAFNRGRVIRGRWRHRRCEPGTLHPAAAGAPSVAAAGDSLRAPAALLCPRPAADIISAVEFDHTGDFLATGDQGGRVVLFERIAASRAVRATAAACQRRHSRSR